MGVAIVSHSALATSPPVVSSTIMIQVDRYSVAAVGPTAEQRDLLSITQAIAIPSEIASLGEAVRWVLRDSGYRLADDTVLTQEVVAMLELPLPAAHRRFDSMSLRMVLALMVGPAFQIVQDPVLRLLAFERCDRTPDQLSLGGAL